MVNKGTFKAIVDLFVCSKSAEIALLSFMHLIWTGILGHFEPVPQRMIISFYISMVSLAVRLWAIIPRLNSKGNILRKKCKTLLYRYLWSLFVVVLLNYGVATLLDTVSRTVHWLAAIVVPMSKIFHDYIIGSLVIKYASVENHARAK